MTPSDARRDHLQKVAGWATKARVELGGVQEEHAGLVHFRPASQGVAMVGLLPERPQRGKSGIRNLVRLREEFDQRFRRDCVEVEQGRPTPEKALQSWIIADALRNGREMKPIGASGRSSASKLLFITDELLLVDGEGRRRICDLLAFRTTDGVTGVPVVIELKSARQMTRLIEQVVGYTAMVDEHAAEFEKLYGAVLGHDVRFTGPPEQGVVWPADSRRPDRRTEEFRGWGIGLVGYEEGPEGYTFVGD